MTTIQQTSNPFTAFMEENMKEKDDTVIVRQFIDFNSLKGKINTVSLVGRDGKASLVIIPAGGSDGKLLAHVKKDIPNGRRFSEYLITLAAEAIEKLVERGLNANVWTVDAVAIAWRQFRKITRDMGNTCYDIERVIDAITSSKFYQPTEEDSEEMKNDREMAKEAVIRFAKAMAEADRNGIYINIQKYNEFNKINLIVPEDVEVNEGDVVKFVNGATNSGITAPGWKNINRDRATIHVNVDNQGVSQYWIVQKNPERLTYTERLYLDAVGKQFAIDCPVKVAKVESFNEEIGADFLAL